MILPKQLWGVAARQEFSRNVVALIEKNGGRDEVVQRMTQLGMGRVAQSWSAHGSFEPISGEQLHRLFGTGVLRALAAKLDVQPRELVRQLAHALPQTMARLSAERTARPVPTPAARTEPGP